MKQILKELLSALEEESPRLRRMLLTVNGNCRRFPTFEEVEAGLQELNDSPDSFVVLERFPPLHGCVYLQSALPAQGFDDGKGYLVELRLKQENTYKQYRLRTHSLQEVIEIFMDFYIADQLPNLTNWEDITHELPT